MSGPGWQVHGWRYPVVWWARRKPGSAIRQRAWDLTDRIAWWSTRRKKALSAPRRDCGEENG